MSSPIERTPPMDLPAVAARLRVSERHVHRLVFERRIPLTIEWGHLLRFDPDDLEMSLAQGRVPVAEL